MNVLKRAVEMSHEIINRAIVNGDIAVDCTAGNGNDTLFLAQLVGVTGKVYSFDIQEKAVENTNKKVINSGYDDRVKIIKDSHANIDKYIDSQIKAAMFNLGYLPGGEHNIVTQPESTVEALQKLLSMLKIGGVITIAIYYGHPGGEHERDSVFGYVSTLDQDHFAVQKIEFMNFINYPPILICIEKLA